MKKLDLLFIAVSFAMTASAQLRVDSLGHTNITIQSSLYPSFSIGNKKPWQYTAAIQSTSRGALYLHNDSVNNNTSAGLYVNWKGDNGIYAQAKGGGVWKTGIKGVAEGAFSTCGTFGGLSNSSSTFGAGIIGSSTSGYSTYVGIYAGYFNGDVRVTGSIYGTVLSPTSTSNLNSDEQNTTMPTNNVSVTEKLQGVSLLQMQRIHNNGSLPADVKLENPVLTRLGTSSLMSGNVEERIKEEQEEPTQTKLSAVSYGLAADQLKQVFPELVYQDKEGNYSVNYVEMVPILVQAINELSAEVSVLKAQLGIREPAKPMKNAPQATNLTDDVSLTVPDNAQTATLTVYDLSGKQVRTATVNGTTVDTTAYTRGLPTGSNVCTLMVDGKVQGTRKVVVKE